MKKYKVNVNGTVYEIEIEEVSASDIKAEPVKDTQPKTKPEPKAAPVSTGGGKVIQSPMPGTILSVNVTEGQTVKSGDLLMILEAMKMENEILAPCDGIVSSISVAKSANVEAGTTLCTIS